MKIKRGGALDNTPSRATAPAGGCKQRPGDYPIQDFLVVEVLLGAPNNRTVEAPNGATNISYPDQSLRIPKKLMATKPPINEFNSSHF